jgi:uncharacterized protein
MDDELKSSRTALQRRPARGHYDFETVAAILDAGIFCHVGYTVDSQPYVIPTGYGREGRRLYLHGAKLSRTLIELGRGIPVCVTVTHLDGIVIARSGFHSSINYRSVMILGQAEPVSDADKEHALSVIVEHIAPGHWAASRPPTREELHQTAVVALDIVEASAKVRTGPPIDDEQDYGLPIWAGVIPIETFAKEPLPDPKLKSGIALPDYVARWRRRSAVNPTTIQAPLSATDGQAP